MSLERGSKINLLITGWPNAAVATSSYLAKSGYNYDLIKRYRRSGWIKPIGRGAFARVGDTVDWTGGLFAIQEQLKLPIHAAAKTALELQGVAHFVPLGKKHPLYLSGASGTKLPAWFENHDWDRKIVYVTLDLFSGEQDLGITKLKFGAYSICLSSRERAILELIHLVPQNQQYDEARLLTDGLRTPRPKLLQQLLEKCTSIKVKRIFLHLAEAGRHEWFSELDLSKIKLGKGKRVIGEGGKYDPKYQISVPTVSTGESSTDKLEGP